MRIRRGSTVIKAPDASSSAYARIAATTIAPMVVGLVSSQRICTTLGLIAPVEASKDPKSKSWVKTMQPADLAHVMSSVSGADGSPTSLQWWATHPDRSNTLHQSGDRFISIRIFTKTPSSSLKDSPPPPWVGPSPQHAMPHRPARQKCPHLRGKDEGAESLADRLPRLSARELCPQSPSFPGYRACRPSWRRQK